MHYQAQEHIAHILGPVVRETNAVAQSRRGCYLLPMPGLGLVMPTTAMMQSFG